MKTLDPLKLEKLAFILKAASHPLRLGIIDLLDKNKRLSVNDICSLLDSDQSLTSHHLKNMKLTGVLSSEREGQQVFYSLRLKQVAKVIRCLEKCDLK